MFKWKKNEHFAFCQHGNTIVTFTLDYEGTSTQLLTLYGVNFSRNTEKSNNSLDKRNIMFW